MLEARRLNPLSPNMQVTSVTSTAKALAGTFAAMRELGIKDRRLFDSILRETLAQNPQYLGVWSVWEPNALDGRDSEFVNKPGHDETGRFVPLWNRGGGTIHLEANLGYDVPGLGDWYQVPMRAQTRTVLDPYEFPFAGRREFITSQVAPIFFRGECVGATGVDVPWMSWNAQSLSGLEEALSRGYIFLNRHGHVEYWSARTRDLLSRFIGTRLTEELPAALAGHVARLRRAGQPAELPPLRRGAAVLRLKFARHPQSEKFLITVEESTAAASMAASLSTREREVLEWLGQGKSNSEIGIILAITTHTVKRHVERVLAKLGVENRYAAALVGLQDL